MICFPNIKINLGLHVINRRTDGFHNIETVFYPVKLADVLEIIEAETRTEQITFTSSGLPIDGNAADNLIVKAYQLLHQDFQLPKVQVHLHKIIPMGAGLGGGSSNAAYMITLLNQKFNLKLSSERMESYAAQLGSDCAFFISNKPAYVYGKGYELEPIEISLNEYYLVLLNTGLHSSTALAYQHVRRREVLDVKDSLKENIKCPVSQWKECMENDFEYSVFQALPLLKEIKNDLYDSGAVYASMSGSGAAMFALYTKKPQLPEKLRPYVCFEGLL
ncbi:MAG: 4-(cytidine 5'-diphospho)-2-C-methyl-D-erythritol kinase [Bacteroidota bacterium]